MKKAMLPVSVFILCALLAACGDKAEETAQAPHPKAGTTNRYGWTVPEKTIEFSVYEGPLTPTPEEEAGFALVDQFLKDEFNVVIHNVNNRQEITEHLNMMLASNSYPDVITAMPDAMAEMFRAQNRAIELTPLLQSHGQNVLSGYGNYINLLKTDDGKLYKLAHDWGNTTDVMGQDFAIRYDMWEKTGLPMFDSFESFYNMVKTVVAQNPTNKNGEKTYGISAFTLKGEEFYRAPLALMGFKGSDTGFYRENPDGSITHWVDTPEGIEVAKYINRFWRDGLIDPDFQSKTYEESIVFMGNERVVANIGTWWHTYVGGHQIYRTSDPNWTTKKRFQQVTFKPTERTPALISDNFIRTTRMIITDKAKDPEGLMTYLNWEVTPPGVCVASMGVPGPDRCWDLDANGDAAISDKYWYQSYTRRSDPEFNWEYAFEVANGKFAHHIEAPAYSTQGKDPSDGYADPAVAVNLWDWISDPTKLDQSKLDEESRMGTDMRSTSTSYLWDQTMWTVAFPPEAEETTIQQNIRDAIVAEWIRVFTAPTEAECVTRFGQMRDNLYRLGLEQLIAYQQAAYQKNVAKFNGEFPISN